MATKLRVSFNPKSNKADKSEPPPARVRARLRAHVGANFGNFRGPPLACARVGP